MVDGCLEPALGRDIWVARRKHKVELQRQVCVGRSFGSGDGADPVQHVTVVGKCADTRCWGSHQGHQFGLQARRSVSTGCLLRAGGAICTASSRCRCRPYEKDSQGFWRRSSLRPWWMCGLWLLVKDLRRVYVYTGDEESSGCG